MKYSEIENIWSIDLGCISNADRGRIYYERAKQVVQEALSDPKERLLAIEGDRFRRDYLVGKVGCAYSATSQNPRIRALLNKIDGHLLDEKDKSEMAPISKSIEDITDISELRSITRELKHQIERQSKLIATLRKRQF